MKRRFFGVLSVVLALCVTLCAPSAFAESEPNEKDGAYVGGYNDFDTEIYDFREDGLLFSADDESSSALAEYFCKVPADALPVLPEGEGFIADRLLSSVIFNKRAVILLGWLINRGLAASAEKVGTAKNANTLLRKKALSLVGTMRENTRAEYEKAYSEALIKTDSGREGGYLSFEEANSPVALAYYLLTNMFRKSPDAGGDAYNVKLGDFKVLRVAERLDKAQCGTGIFSFDSSERLPVFDAGEKIICESQTARDESSTAFTPCDGRGFDSERVFGNSTDSEDAHNRCFCAVSRATFRYSSCEEQFISLSCVEGYVYVNGRFAGACRADEGVSVSLDNEAFGLCDGEYYPVEVFFRDSGEGDCNLTIKTNLSLCGGSLLAGINAYKADGQKIPSSASVYGESPVFYELSVENCSRSPVYDLSFEVPSLGISISPRAVQLFDGGAGLSPMKATEIKLTYYSANAENSGEVTVITPSGDDELKKLLSEGIGAGCSVTVGLFERKSTAGETAFSARLAAACRVGSGDSAVTKYLSGMTVCRFISKKSTQVFTLSYGDRSEYSLESILSASEMRALESACEREGAVSLSLVSGKGMFGTATLDAKRLAISYTPERFMSGADAFQLEIRYYTGVTLTEIAKTVCFSPAASVLYDDSFTSSDPGHGFCYSGRWATEGDAHYARATEEKLNSGKDSVKFRFSGTGFEANAENSAGAGVVNVIAVRLDGDGGKKLRAFLVDLSSPSPLSLTGLEYGEYEVTIIASASGILVKKMSDGSLRKTLTASSRCDFRFTGVRIISAE